MTIDFSGVPWFWLMFFMAVFVLPAVRQLGAGRGGRRALEGHELERARREIATLRSELEERILDVDTLHARVAELENRLDFTERLLTQHHQTASPSASVPLQ